MHERYCASAYHARASGCPTPNAPWGHLILTVLPVPTDQVTAVLKVVQDTLGRAIAGVYLYGSAVAGALRPASDLDLLVVTRRQTSEVERGLLVERLTPISSLGNRPGAWRPVELTIVVDSDVRPWRYPPRMEFQYGEWMRRELDAGIVPGPRVNPDLAVLLSMVIATSQPLVGPPATDLLASVAPADLRRAMRAGIPDLLADLPTDTTNVLLTLARIWMTLETSGFSSKDAAADWAVSRMPPERRSSLEHARDVHRGDAPEQWHGRGARVTEDTGHLVRQIESLVPD